jgi:hypothetical protein
MPTTRTRTTRTPTTRTRTTPTTATARAGVALARCVAPVDAEAFLEDLWEREPLHVGRDEPARFDALLNRSEAERLITATGMRTPAFRLVKAGGEVSGYTSDIPWRPRPFTGAADVRRILAEFDAGATIVLQALHVTHEPVAAFARELELELRHPVQVNAYYTPSSAQGLPVHHDTHDVFVLQTSGEKRWLVYEPVLELPLRSQRYSPNMGEPGPVVLDVTLRAGDSLYLPRGWLHEAVTSEHDSLHLTVGVNVVTWFDALRAALDDAGGELALRRSLEAGSADDALAALAGHLEVREIERRRNERLARRARPLLAEGFDQLRGLEGLTAETPLERTPSHAFVRPDGDSLVLLHDGGELRLPAHVGDDLDEILTTDGTFTAAELAGPLDADGRLVLVQRLVREAVLRIAD